MDKVGDQRPGKALGLRFVNDGGKPLDKIRAIGISAKDLPAFDSPDDSMAHRPRRIDSGFAWHEENLPNDAS
jgi:hypothetical protein